MSTIPLLMRPKEVAAALRLSEQRLAVMRLNGGGPIYLTIGRSIFYEADSIRDWLVQNRRKSTSDRGDAVAA